MRPRRVVITFFVVVFTVAAVFLLYEGATSGNYAVVAVVLVAYVFVLMAEAYLGLRTRLQPTKK